MFFEKKSKRENIRKKAQTEIISYMIVAGIIIFTTGIAYMWGGPVIEKSSSDSKIQIAQNTLKEINTEIMKIATNGGQTNINLDINGDFKIKADANSIYYLLRIPSTRATSKDWIPISGTNMWGISDTPEADAAGRLGEDEPGILLVRSAPAGDKYDVTFRLAYRELDDLVASGGKKIQLELKGNGMASSGSHTISIKKGEPYISTDKDAVYGGELVIIPIQLILS